ncbi:MAG: phosphatidic acid phosphatase, partial [Thauera sp.]|nr:phosphatidic acid phosphatase [Thauera sp.]
MPTTELAAPLPTRTLDASRSWLLAQVALLTLSALLLYWTFEGTDLDRQLAHMLFDPERGIFPLRNTWFLEAVMHKAAKQVTYVLVAASLYVCWQGWKGRLDWLPPRNALLAALGMVAIPLATSTVKLLTARYCPWDIVDFGGYAPYLGLF